MICQAKPAILKTPFFQTDFARTIVRKNGAFFKNRGDFSHRYPLFLPIFRKMGALSPMRLLILFCVTTCIFDILPNYMQAVLSISNLLAVLIQTPEYGRSHISDA